MLNAMKRTAGLKRLAPLFFLVCHISALGAAAAKPFRVIRLSGAELDQATCDTKWSQPWRSMLWMDDDHLVVSEFFSCRHPRSTTDKAALALTVFDTNGHHISSISEFDSRANAGPLAGPSGTILVLRDRNAVALDNQLRPVQTLPCPDVDATCSIYAPLSKSAGSDFAICSSGKLSHECTFYRGLPSEPLSGANVETTALHAPANPYRQGLPQAVRGEHLFEVGPSDFWYFNGPGGLMRLDSHGDTTPVASGKWASKPYNCEGSVSRTPPLRFLAVCWGAHVYTDGDLDALFGFSRIALFDVPSRKIIAQINGRPGTKVALSPSGQIFAVQHKDQIRFYRVP
jgi:hypothetical protein